MALNHSGGVITTQVGQPLEGGFNQSMHPPALPPGCPPGLEYLGTVDQILCKQKVELLEALLGCETNNHYIVRNTLGQQIYRVDEETEFCMRIWCGPARGFVLHVIDNNNKEVMRITREFKCCAGCCWCADSDHCAFLVRVEAPIGTVIGYTRQMQSCCRIMLDVLNERRELIFKIRGPICPCGCADVEFPVLTSDGSMEIGRITKQWTGLVKESFTDADNFSISWPMDLDIKMKATLIGTLFLVIGQPMADLTQSMHPPAPLPGCPPGLQYLGTLDQILCKQKVELLEAFTGWETNNHFIMKNTLGQPIYQVDEETGTCMRLCCGPARGFVLHVIDNNNQEVMRITRDFKCCAGCCWCACADHCAFEVRVEAPIGTVIGYTRQLQSCCRIMLDVLNENHETIFKIRGPICPCGCADVEFPVLTSDGSKEIGRITKQWTGFAKETFTDADNFSISWPMDLDIKMKATLIGTLFLVDFMAFEKTKKKNH